MAYNDSAQNRDQEPLLSPSDRSDDLPQQDSGIIMARLLGFGGLIPFLFLAGATIMGLRLPFAPAPALLIGYGAIILSFVGALHWGAQLTRPVPSAVRFFWSIVPALLGWVALMLAAKTAAILLIAGLLICWAYDMRVMKIGEWPAYMRSLRTVLTFVACLSLSVILWPLS